MHVTASRFATKSRTWLLIATLTALLIGIGALVGGTPSSEIGPSVTTR